MYFKSWLKLLFGIAISKLKDIPMAALNT